MEKKKKGKYLTFQVALVVKNPPANARDTREAGLIPGSGRSPREGNSYPLQDSCLENSMNRSLVGYSPRDRKGSDMTEQVTLHTKDAFLEAQ